VATRRRDNHYDLDMNDIHRIIEWVSKKIQTNIKS